MVQRLVAFALIVGLSTGFAVGLTLGVFSGYFRHLKPANSPLEEMGTNALSID